jgi:polysaccharide transporter, PST family
MNKRLPPSQARSRIKSIISNAGWLGMERMLRAATSFLVVVWIARTLGPEMFGALNFAQSIVIGLVPVVTMGLNPVLVRDLVQQVDKRDALLASAALLRLAGALILMMAALTLAYVLSDHDPQIMWLVAIVGLGVFAYAADGIDSDYQARMQNKTIVLIKLVGFVICTLLKIVLIVVSAGVEWFAAVMTFESLLIALMMWRAAQRDGFGFVWRPKESVIRSLILQAAPMFLVALFGNLFGRVDQVLLGSMAGYEVLGSYAVAWKIVEVLCMFPYFAVTALAPALSALQRESQDLFKSRYILATRILFWSSIVVCVVLSFALPEILPWIFGPRYVDAIDPLKILLWVLPMILLGHMTFQWALHMGGMRFVIVQGAFMLLVGTLLCWLLIGFWGQVGAAVGILVTQLLANLLYPLLWPIGRRILAVQCQSVVGWRR